MTHFRIYRITAEEGATREGGKLEWNHSCSGESHAALLIELFRKENEVVHATVLATVVKGPCDGTCIAANLGGFIYP